jgi:hypothetical protein
MELTVAMHCTCIQPCQQRTSNLKILSRRWVWWFRMIVRTLEKFNSDLDILTTPSCNRQPSHSSRMFDPSFALHTPWKLHYLRVSGPTRLNLSNITLGTYYTVDDSVDIKHPWFRRSEESISTIGERCNIWHIMRNSRWSSRAAFPRPSLSVEYKTAHPILRQIIRAGLFSVLSDYSLVVLDTLVTMWSNFMFPFAFLIVVSTSIIPANAAPVPGVSVQEFEVC